MKSVLLKLLLPVFVGLILVGCHQPTETTEPQAMHGWNILTDNDSIALRVIEKAKTYGINHLQLSHSIVMDLKDVKEKEVAQKVNRLTKLAHDNNIGEVTIWDHSLYNLNYYPDKFKTGPNGTLDLDNSEFWAWIKEDYRAMLDLVPNVDGIILTFIETGAHVEDQYSEKLKTEEEKLAAMVDTLASVIIDEYDKSLYIRTFMYTRAELKSMLKAINLMENPHIKVMTKEVPHDFFITHPPSSFVKEIKRPVLIEFDAGHEYNGQSILTSLFPKVHVDRMMYYAKLPNVTGYVARTDRKGNTTVIDNPTEINVYALHHALTHTGEPDMEEIYDGFISENYGKESVKYLKPAFKMAPDIILSSLYTLGLPLNTHSRLDIENDGAYQRHVSGKWMDDMHINLNRGNDTTLHYWKGIVNHLAPTWYKGENSNQLSVESHWVLDSNWLDNTDLMNKAYLDLIVNEKAYGVEKAREALELVRQAGDFVENPELYQKTLHMFERTYISARLYKEVASLYFAYRVYYKDTSDENGSVLPLLQKSLENIPPIVNEILAYPHSGAEGQFIWRNEAYRAMRYYLEFKSFEGDYKQAYTPETFERFHYFGVTEEEKQDLYERFMKEVN